VRHPSLGEEELEVLSHSLDKEGNIEQYEVNPPFGAHQHGQTMTLEASEVTITKEQIHKHPPKKIKVEMSMKKRRAIGNM
jgi:hypothetical protein